MARRTTPVIHIFPRFPTWTPGLERPAGFSARAFSMLELLVAIGLVVILATILFTTVRSLTSSGNRTACLSNLRGLAAAIRLHVADNNGHLPHRDQTPDEADRLVGTGRQWSIQLLPYLGVEQPAELGARSPFYCPAADPLNPQHPWLSLSYAFNYDLSWRGGAGEVPRARGRPGNNVAEIEHPSEVFLLAEITHPGQDGSGNWPAQDRGRNIRGGNNNILHLRLENPAHHLLIPYHRHAGRVNVLYVDGHVAAREPVDGEAGNWMPQSTRAGL